MSMEYLERVSIVFWAHSAIGLVLGRSRFEFTFGELVSFTSFSNLSSAQQKKRMEAMV